MEFFSANTALQRPIRLCEATRAFAWESMHGKYGDDAMAHPNVVFTDPALDNASELERYDRYIREIAQNAPIRICPAERVSGAATLGHGIFHRLPALENNQVLPSISHLTVDFPTILKEGVNSIERKIQKRLQDASLTETQRNNLHSFQNVVDAMHIWHNRYLDALKDTKPETYRLLQRVPFEPAQTFHEAVQSIWFSFAFMRVCGNWPGIGRLDEMLGDYLKKDLAEGRITLAEAREILASLFIKGCEWIQSNTPPASGDAQHYQNIVLSGINAKGEEVTNEVTYLILDVVEELGISDYPITVRLNPNSPEKLLRRVSEVIRFGGGIVAVYNEPLILRAMEQFGYSPEEAVTFANDGCWEVQVPGKTDFGYLPFDALQLLLTNTLHIGEEIEVQYETYADLYKEYLKHLDALVGEQFRYHTVDLRTPDGEYIGEACSVVSVFEEGCIENARQYHSGGPVYRVRSPHIGGAPDVANSLLAINRLVYEEKKVTLAELRKILADNWEGAEPLRQYVLNQVTYYGNGNEEADAYMVQLFNDFADIVMAYNERDPLFFPPGASTFGRQIEWAPHRTATPFGRRKGEILSGNTSPTPGTDAAGATGEIRSYCRLPLERFTTGAALDVKLHPTTVNGEAGLTSLEALLKSFVQLGGFFMQLDVTDVNILRLAQEHPEDYKTLSVRVSGWNARFVTLDRKWQDMVIGQAGNC